MKQTAIIMAILLIAIIVTAGTNVKQPSLSVDDDWGDEDIIGQETLKHL